MVEKPQLKPKSGQLTPKFYFGSLMDLDLTLGLLHLKNSSGVARSYFSSCLSVFVFFFHFPIRLVFILLIFVSNLYIECSYFVLGVAILFRGLYFVYFAYSAKMLLKIVIVNQSMSK